MIGGFTAPKPTPKTEYAASSQPRGVPALKRHEHQAPRGHRQAADDQRAAHPARADDAAGDRADHHGHGRQGQRAQAGAQGREVSHFLQVERVEEQEAPKAAKAATAMIAAAENGRLAKKRGSMSGSTRRSS